MRLSIIFGGRALIVLAFALVVLPALFVTAILRPPSRPAALLSVYLLSYADIVFVGEVSNSLYQLNNAWVWLGLHLLIAAAAGLVWLRAGRPSLKAPFIGPDGRIIPTGLLSSFKSKPELWLLGAGVAAAFLFNLYLIWIMPPNNNDSLSTHMSRVAYWVQRGSFFPWPTQRVWQITYPVDMQLQMLWTVLFLRSDRLVEIVQWLGALAALAAVIGLARLLGATRSQAIFAGLLLATFPEILLESTTTQNDLVAGTLFVAMLYLLFLGLPRGKDARADAGSLALSGLALGLCLGTKQTLFFLLPGLALTLALVWIIARRPVFRSLVIWGAGALAAFLLLGIYMFVVNLVSFGHPMGPETAVEAQTGGQTSQSLRDNLVYNTFRLAYQSIDPTGLPDPWCGYSFKAKGAVTGVITGLLHFPVEEPIAVATGHVFNLRERYVVQEDAGWYGPIFALLVLPALLVHLMIGIRRRDALRLGIFILSLTFLLLDAAFRPGWDPYQGRYFIPVVMISTPLAGFVYRGGRWWRVAARWAIVALALVVAINTILSNTGKPVVGSQSLWNMDRTGRITLQNFRMRSIARTVDQLIPADATVGLLTNGSFQEYPFFGEDYSRRLVQIEPGEKIKDLSWLKARGIEYVLVLERDAAQPVHVPAGLVAFAHLDGWTLLTWAP